LKTSSPLMACWTSEGLANWIRRIIHQLKMSQGCQKGFPLRKQLPLALIREVEEWEFASRSLSPSITYRHCLGIAACVSTVLSNTRAAEKLPTSAGS
jgi:hypothetical protein